MSYVRANTAPAFGQRAQSLSPLASRIGYYFPSAFPLPTTSMSRPVRLGDPGMFDEAPYPAYPQPETSSTRATAVQLAGEWVPPSPPGRALFTQNAVTYRINPQTGQYEFRSTDVLPRGVWQQNVFQPPAKPSLSSLGVPMPGQGTTLAQIGGRTVVMKTTPGARNYRRSGGLFGDGCGCGCSGCSGGLGAPGDPCSLDSDCPGGACDHTSGSCYAVGGGTPGPIFTSPTGVSTNANGTVVSGPSQLQQIANAIGTATNAVPPLTQSPIATAGFQPPSWFTASTIIAGMPIPNMLLAGAALFFFASAGGGHRR